MIPSVRFSLEELVNGLPSDDMVSRAASLFAKSGCLVLEDVFAREFIETLHTSYIERYERYFVDKEHPDALTVGDKRFMITVNLQPPFSTPHLYANPLVLPIIRAILGQDFILSSFGSVVSLPGSAEQHVHRDLGQLFPGHPISMFVPSFAMTVIVPLVDLSEATGTTRMWPRSHVVPDDKAKTLTSEDPFATAGTCLLMDYRLKHTGTANRSDCVRPILYNVYSRPWFMDYSNYRKQPPLLMSDEEYGKVPEEWKELLINVRHI